MKSQQLNVYVCPKTKKALEFVGQEIDSNEIISGNLVCGDISYPIINGIPNLTYPQELAEIDETTRKTYNELAQNYHLFADIPFQTFKEPEHKVREKLVAKLSIGKGDRVLEVGCGCGHGSKYLAQAIGKEGELYLQDLAPEFLNKAVEYLAGEDAKIEYSVANASCLPFPDNYFDAAHHFGGSNTFADIEGFLAEMARVVKPGGKVVFGDEGIGSWLRDTDFAKIMINSNPLLDFTPPLKYLPKIAKNVSVEWIMMDAFFVLEFTVADAEPVANYHVPIPSKRGGTHWTRYYGQLEGVSDEIKALAQVAREQSGKSMTQWLEDVVKEAAEKELGK